MVTLAVSPGVVNYSGNSLTTDRRLGVDDPDPIIVYGEPIGITTAEDPTYTAVDAVRARVVDDTGAFVRHLDKLDGLRWLDEFNSAGAGSIDARVFFDGADTAPTGVLSPDQHIIVSVGSRDVFRIVLDAQAGYRVDANGNRIDAWAGAGALGVLNNGMVIPEYGWRAEATDQRTFDYGSNPAIGGWRVAGEWVTPVGKPVRSSWRWTYKKRHLPKKWPEKKAQWLWWRNPDATGTVDETCYLQSSVTLTAGRYKIWVCGDDTLELQVDGEVRATTGPGGWKTATKVVMNLSAGAHTLAAKVSNTPTSAGNQNRSGFLFAMARINGDGDVVEWVRRSTPSAWTVRRQRSEPPGWRTGQVFRQLTAEQKARSVASHSLVTYGFTTTTDSAGRAWTGRNEVQIPVGTLGLDWVQQLVELGIDVYMSPTLVLYAYRSRGVDRSAKVRIDQGGPEVTDASGSPEAPIRNSVYARARTGWVGRDSSTSIATRGRRESMASFGSSRSAVQTGAMLSAMLPDLASPPQTHQISISGAADGPKPYSHFNNGDWIGYRAPGRTSWVRCRVLSIGGEVNPAGHADWTVQVVED